MRATLNELSEGLRIALVTIWANKLRALLTTLGIVIGIVSVTAMFTAINGIERSFDRSMALIGNDALFVQKMPWFMSMDDWFRMRSRPDIGPELADRIAQQSRYAEAVAPLTGGSQTLRYEGEELRGVSVEASTEAYAETGGLEVVEGRFYTEADVRAARPVAVIGTDVVEGLFPGVDPLGKRFRVGPHRFEVIGVLAERGRFLGLASTDNRIIVPITTYDRLIAPVDDVAIKVKVASPEAMDAAEDELMGIVRAARGLDPMADENFAINRQEQFRQIFQTVKATTYGVGLFLTALSLLVGGIGVMNIMFVSVKERTREIGIRKAVGARRRSILIQFLLEAVMICVVAGAIGVAISFGVTFLINLVFTAVLTPGTVLLAFTICVLVGVIFGLLPAWQAARSRPIEALRYE